MLGVYHQKIYLQIVIKLNNQLKLSIRRGCVRADNISSISRRQVPRIKTIWPDAKKRMKEPKKSQWLCQLMKR